MSVRDPKSGQFLQGASGNPKGRPVGARSKLGEAFLEALNKDFDAHGEQVICEVRVEKPDQYLKVIASLMPKEMSLTVNDPLEDLTDDEIATRLSSLHTALSSYLGDGSGDVGGGAGQAHGAVVSDPIH